MNHLRLIVCTVVALSARPGFAQQPEASFQAGPAADGGTDGEFLRGSDGVTEVGLARETGWDGGGSLADGPGSDDGGASPGEGGTVDGGNSLPPDNAPIARERFRDTGTEALTPVAPVEAADAGASDRRSFADADLLPDGGQAVRETVVLGRRETETSGSVHVVKPSELERFERDDPHAVIRSVPGAYVREEDGFGLRPNIGLRGANSDRSKKITLLEDGVLLGPAPYSAPAAYYFPLITRMVSVRVVKGPSAITQGPQTVGGSVEFITRDVPRSQSLFVDVAGGEYLYGKAHARYGFGDENSGALIEGVHLRNGGFKELDGGGDTGFTRNEWMAKARHKLSDRHTFVLKVGFSDERSNETYLGQTDEDLRANPNRRYVASRFDQMNWHRTQLQLSHTFAVDALSVTTTAYRHDFNRTWHKVNRFRGAALSSVLAAPEAARNALFYSVLTGAQDSSTPAEQLMIGPNQRSFVSQGLQTVGVAEAWTGPLSHRLELGARWHYDRADRTHTEDAHVMVGGAPLSAELPTETTVSNRDSTHAVALHLADAIVYERFALTPGVRVELIQSQALDRLAGTTTKGATSAVLPGIGAHAAINKNAGVFAGVYRGFSPPPPGQGNESPELSVNYEAGARWTPRRGRVEVIGFFNDYSNLTDLCTFSSGCIVENLDRQFSAGSAYIYGAEVFGSKMFQLNQQTRLPASVSYTFTQTYLRENFVSADPQLGNVREGDELPYVPQHQLYASAGVERELFGVSIAGTYTGAMREQAGQDEDEPQTDPLLTFDLNVSVRPVDRLRVYLNVRNVLDNQQIVSRRPFGARSNAPRMAQLGLSYGF